MHLRCVEYMQRKGSVSGIESDYRAAKCKDFEHCIKGKMTRSTMMMRTIKAKNPGDVVYRDLCGLMPIKSLAGASYFVAFSDQFYGFMVT